MAARSTLIGEPTCNWPRVVMFRLCSITSNRACCASTKSVTVRHTPSCDTLAPMARSWQKPGGKATVNVRRPGWSSMALMEATA
ncbi:hypothetical protein D3C72_2078010 [compost metagenome]